MVHLPLNSLAVPGLASNRANSQPAPQSHADPHRAARVPRARGRRLDRAHRESRVDRGHEVEALDAEGL